MTITHPAPGAVPDDEHERDLGHARLAASPAPVLRTALPGPVAAAWVARDRAVTSPSLPRAYPVVPARAAGAVIEDVDGNLLLDANAGIAVCATGHGHPAVVDAIRRQSAQYLHYSASDFYQPTYIELCERLAAVAPFAGPARVLLGNSGTEAVEAAVKLARHATGRPNLIAFHGGFHGRTLGSLSLTASRASHRTGFGPLLPGVHHVPYGADPEGGDPFGAGAGGPGRVLEDVLFRRLCPPEEVAAVVVEPIQGEGGYVVPPPGWLADLADLCRRHGILLVADEIQCGMGRTGRLWAVEHEDVEPDILVSAKGLASGLPLGAVIGRAELFGWPSGRHGSTFGGNPLSCAAALATLDLLDGGLLEHAAAMGARLVDGLVAVSAAEPLVVDVRGRGLMVGVQFANGELAHAAEQACFARGLLVLTCGEATVRFSPPLVITAEQVDTAVAVFADVCSDLTAT